jgi:hypothetical protein
MALLVLAEGGDRGGLRLHLAPCPREGGSDPVVTMTRSLTTMGRVQADPSHGLQEHWCTLGHRGAHYLDELVSSLGTC